ncbi:MAG: LytTR family transcriptional regulator [Oscillospiraceae bacterium]|nr:LytTR family transcriptional regulator [Oscillospiraceae bacterium]
MNISESIKEPYAVINTDELTPEIAALAREIAAFGNGRNVIIGNLDERMVIIEPEKIVLIRVESEKVYVVTEDETYRVGKRMYELLEVLGKEFMQVSKSAAINLSYLESVEPSFNGIMLLHMKNGEKEYISRKYVPGLRKYLGI